MLTLEDTMSQAEQGSMSRGVNNEAQYLNALCERLLREQPQSAPLLRRLLARSRRTGKESPFAQIKDGRCSACNMAVASAQVQKARAGIFVNCAHCTAFLYHNQR